MKITKLLSVICAVALVMTFVCVPAVAVGESYIYLEHVSTEGTKLVFDICVRDLSELNFKSFGTYLNYSSNISFEGCEFYPESGTGTTDGFIIPGIPYQILWTSSIDTLGTDKVSIARLTFNSNAPINESIISISLAVDITNLPKNADGKEFDNVMFAGMTIENGVIPPSPVREAIPGDANEDGKVNLTDATVMLQHVAQWIVGLNIDNADVNDDSFINLSDITLILKHIARWDVELK